MYQICNICKKCQKFRTYRHFLVQLRTAMHLLPCARSATSYSTVLEDLDWCRLLVVLPRSCGSPGRPTFSIEISEIPEAFRNSRKSGNIFPDFREFRKIFDYLL